MPPIIENKDHAVIGIVAAVIISIIVIIKLIWINLKKHCIGQILMSYMMLFIMLLKYNFFVFKYIKKLFYIICDFWHWYNIQKDN